MNTKQITFPTVEEQIEYWNTKERIEHERVMDIRADSPNQSTETGKVNPRTCAHDLGLYAICKKCGAWPPALQ